jgi:hypothetical protein
VVLSRCLLGPNARWLAATRYPITTPGRSTLGWLVLLAEARCWCRADAVLPIIPRRRAGPAGMSGA